MFKGQDFIAAKKRTLELHFAVLRIDFEITVTKPASCMDTKLSGGSH
jgi:hypothetical protein